MIIVSDTTPFRYLIEVEAIDVLAVLFGQIIIPKAVATELQHPKTPQKIKNWMQAPPNWLEIRKADLSYFTPVEQIGPGETEAIALALELRACTKTKKGRSFHRKDAKWQRRKSCLR